ncbi:hypothetical protein RN001_014620 [Aquatica leii]|uniref:Endonuclease/exonuclease/phosphatase domain-containing protein n=1 Tax=Aquatica leii TaxID=1421715 RepID=A0AAN7NZU6_9COLE|nr:hypothetical protein RN001_014620 [Aquatica leii]
MTKDNEKVACTTQIIKKTEKRKNKSEVKVRNIKKKKQGKIKIGTWNIRSMIQPGKMRDIVQTLEKYKIDIIAIQELRWAEEGEINRSNYTIFWSGGKKQGKNGTGFIVTQKQMKNIIKFEAINDRISKLRIRGQISNTTLICVYAPTEVDTNEKKEDFYEKLIRECEKTPKYDTLIILGDLNAQVGKEDHIKTVAGKHTIHEKTNDNGNRICNLAAAMNLYLASTKFPHPTKHKIT